jgi:hypothetical protein
MNFLAMRSSQQVPLAGGIDYRERHALADPEPERLVCAAHLPSRRAQGLTSLLELD